MVALPYSEEIVKKYRTDQMTKNRIFDKLALAGIKGDDRDEWWRTPLRSFHDRAPESIIQDDPLFVLLAAEAGITAANEHPRWIAADGSILVAGAVCPCKDCYDEGNNYDEAIPDAVADAQVPSVLPGPVVESNNRVRDTVDAEELDALRELPSGPYGVPSTPDWWA
jgi:hypothetical protein